MVSTHKKPEHEQKSTTKKSFLRRLKEKLFKHKKKILIGTAVAATAGAAAYAYNRNSKIKALKAKTDKDEKKIGEQKRQISNQKRKRIEELTEVYKDMELLKNFPTIKEPITNTSFNNFYKEANERILKLKAESEKLYGEYQQNLNNFISNLEEIRELEKQKSAFGKRRRNRNNRFGREEVQRADLGEFVTGLQINNKEERLAELSQKYFALQEKLNASLNLYLEVMIYYESQLENIILVIKETDFNSDEKQQLIQTANSELASASEKIKSEQKINNDRQRGVEETQLKYKKEIARLGELVKTTQAEVKSVIQENNALSNDLNQTTGALEQTSKDLKKKSDQLDNAEAAIQSKDEQIAQINANASLSEQEKNNKINALEAQKDSLNQNLEKSKEETAIIAQKLDSEIMRADKLLKELSNQNLQTTLEALYKQVTEIENEMKDIDTKLELSDKNSKEFRDLLADRKKKDEQRLKIMNHDITELKKKKEQIDRQIKQAEKNIEEARLEMKKLVRDDINLRMNAVRESKQTRKKLYKKRSEEWIQSGITKAAEKARLKAIAAQKEAERLAAEAERLAAEAKTKAEQEAAERARAAAEKAAADAAAAEKAAADAAKAAADEEERQQKITALTEKNQKRSDKRKKKISALLNAAEIQRGIDKKEIEANFGKIRDSLLKDFYSNDAPQYMKDIKADFDKQKNLDLVKSIEILRSGETLFTTFILYNDELMTTPYRTLYTKIYNLVKKDTESLLNTLIDAPASKAELTNFVNNDLSDINNEKWSNIDMIKDFTTLLLKTFQECTKLTDKIFPVRIVMNFANRNVSRLPNLTDEDVLANYTITKQNPNKQIVTNILEQKYREINNIEKIPSDVYGPYFKVTDTNKTHIEYKVESDILSFFINSDDDPRPPHIIYSAYGFSGSGKSYTLISDVNKNNVLRRVMASIQKLSKSKNINVNYSYRMYDIYGEYKNARIDGKIDRNDKGCNVGVVDTNPDVEPKHTYYKEEHKTNFENFNDPSTIDKSVIEFEKSRKQNKNENGRTEYHIRSTPNNPESSRSHLFIDIDVKDLNGKLLGRVTILDMAGSENVDTIQSSYFENVKTDYDTSVFTKYFESSKGVKIHFCERTGDGKQCGKNLNVGGDAVNQLIYIIPDDYGIMNTIDSLFHMLPHVQYAYHDMNGEKLVDFIKKKNIPQIISGSNSDGTYIIKDNWKLLKEQFKTDGVPVHSDMGDFINNYNYYNYCKIVEPFIKLRTLLSTLFQNCYENTSNQISFPKPGDDKLATKFDVANVSVLNNFFKEIGIPQLDNNYVNIIKLYNKKSGENYNPYTSEFAKKKSTSIKAITEQITGVTNKIVNQIVNTDNGNFFNLLIKYYKDEGKQALPFTLEMQECINNWNQIYLNQLHCSLRYQGNFIVDSLDEMKKYIHTIQSTKGKENDIKNFPGKYLYGDNTEANKFRVKFVLLTNIRLDFNPKWPYNYNIKNDNLREAYIRSIYFSNIINPLKRGSAFGKRIKSMHFGSKHKKRSKRSKGNKSKKLKKHIQFLKSIKGLIKM